jgi:hypothetical protein
VLTAHTICNYKQGVNTFSYNVGESLKAAQNVGGNKEYKTQRPSAEIESLMNTFGYQAGCILSHMLMNISAFKI